MGPGDPELVTVKALKVLKDADVILYDRLVSEEILSLCQGEKIYVGKSIGEAWKQEEINRKLVEEAKKGKRVVRAKGGDPTVFGRGEEECIFALREGISCEIIPGLTSAIAGPELAGIPVTSRIVAASGFTVISGTRAKGELDPDFIPEKGTLIVLMGIHDIEEVQRVILMKRRGDEKVAIIESASTPKQRVITGTLMKLSELVKEGHVSSPSIIVVGEVVSLSFNQ
ncbi:Uroporphyrinogen-III C-methyltransferase [Sulfuracidifex tepidarius]|uniref:uroporphyrinogen-III C-methyltransferase n=1 Tax=Sulfuracidifex tepidarius TaxID=1294262 RepID=A0A510DYI4_9CREN|nr:Uroporphyrinogen-III C-methyltransferase [Sulfuracidifex tepidarius]BBG28069.1 Uroporphyrinogen-III C-methyltransferase [Sulfuracidifex tepidarius]